MKKKKRERKEKDKKFNSFNNNDAKLKKTKEKRKKKRDKEDRDKSDSILNVKFNLIEAIILVVVSLIFGAIIGEIVSSNNEDDKYLNNFKDVYYSLYNDYYKKVSRKKLIDGAINGMMSELGDPYSTYMDEEESETFNNTVNGSYKGIGVQVSIIDSKVTIVSVFDGSPASRAGLKTGDIINKVNDTDVSGKTLDEVVSLIKKKSHLTLNVTRDSKTFDTELTLSNVDIPSVSSKTFDRNGKKVGYLNISMFSSNTYKQFKNKLTELEKDNIDSLVIDVRDNPGGALDQVTKILSMFMDRKHVLYQIESNGKKTKYYSLSNEKRTYKVVVLINSNSASASEILAGAMNESYGSELVGTTTYGKGTVQKEYTLSNGTSLKYTSEKWLTPRGNSINKKGIKPTIEVSLDDNYYNNPSVDTDNQLQTAIEEAAKK